MKRFHRKVRARIPNGQIFREPITHTRLGAKEFDSQWRHLHRTCGDPASRARLSWLREQFVRHRRGVSDAAQAEVDLASLFLRAGFSVSFLPESWVRTADLECYLGHDRLFVEVTVIVPSERRTRGFPKVQPIGGEDGNGLEDDAEKLLVKRIIARITEKARQLHYYCAPVILAITVPGQEKVVGSKSPKWVVDLKRLSGVLALTFPQVTQLSGVLLTFWDIQPRESKSNVRLNTINLVERALVGVLLPRVRLFASNPTARYPLPDPARLAVNDVL